MSILTSSEGHGFEGQSGDSPEDPSNPAGRASPQGLSQHILGKAWTLDFSVPRECPHCH